MLAHSTRQNRPQLTARVLDLQLALRVLVGGCVEQVYRDGNHSHGLPGYISFRNVAFAPRPCGLWKQASLGRYALWAWKFTA